jgi:alkaline phosphatase D
MHRRLSRSLALACALLAVGLAACSADKETTVLFSHGVASGDPLTDRVILWTRATVSKSDTPVTLKWQVARDAAFADVVASGAVEATAATDYTVKVDATGLSAGTSYNYRFTHDAQVSPVGKTKTLPTGAVSQVKMAVFSCANYPAGFFNAYADAANEPGLDLAIHLGDTIYEYGQGGFASATAAAMGRLVDPAGETVSLSDYRRRHAQYRTDPDMQALMATVPFVVVWDDHEVANDAWTGGAENHDPATQGDYLARRASAMQAFHEWMPTRLPDPAHPDVIYRSFDFGTLASLHMLDTRHIGRDKQLAITSYFNADGSFDEARFTTDMSNPARQLLGATQTAWLQGKLATSTATWQLLGQQVVMGRMNVPVPIATRQVTVTQYSAIALKAATAPGSLTAAELLILNAPSIPYNLDAWDGYMAARETVLGTARALDRNLVVLSGDTHNAWGNDLDDLAGNKVGVELAGAGVTSPGLEAVFTADDPALLAAGITQLIGPLVYADTSRRGWLLVTATPAQVTGDWRFVSTVASRTYISSSGKVLKVLPGATGRRLVAP